LGLAQAAISVKKKHHHKHHHKHHEESPAQAAAPKASTIAAAQQESVGAQKNEPQKEEQILGKMKTLEKELAKKEEAVKGVVTKGRIEVNGPLPANFAERFSTGVSKASGCESSEVKVVETNPVSGSGDVVEVVFEAPADVVKAVEDQAADPDSKLATGNLKEFLVAKEGVEDTPVQEKGIDVDTEMPYGELEPFGREDTAQELTESSIKESDEMVDQLERAEVAEEKRAVFRALTRLRGAAITSFDGVARSQTGNIDEYAKVHKWRMTHPLHHLADEESDVTKWAFPDNADF
jgi:hypothetical protein